jgi:hypothetical protein
MRYRMWRRSIVFALIILIVGVVAVGGRIDRIGEDLTISDTEILPRFGDSGCILIQCARDWVENFGNWQCWTRGTYERYDDQMRPLPIQVRVKGDCWVSTFYGNYFWSCTDTEVGSGRVTATTECWKFAPLATTAGNDGGCLCQEQ